MRDFSQDHSMLALNTATLGHNLDGYGAGWEIEQVIDACAKRGFGAISFWRREIGKRANQIGSLVRGAGMQVCGLCRSPYLTGPYSLPTTQAILDDFALAIEQAHDLGTDVLTVVTGGVIPHSRSRQKSLEMVTDLVARMLPTARQAGVRIALEPLHPVYAGDRSCLVTVKEAVDICKRIDDAFVALAVDVYHVWWDSSLASELQRLGTNGIAGFHLCDWLAQTTDVLLDRGMMGDGVADIQAIRQAVEQAGYTGYCEVEIFSANDWWKRDPNQVLNTIVDRFRLYC